MILWLAAAGAADLTMQVQGLPTDDGVVICALYVDPERWLDDRGATLTVSTRPQDGRATCLFPSVVGGTYAVAFFQDRNENRVMDYTFAGLPKEPWGISRDAPIRFGRPRWVDAVFSHPSAPQVARAR